MFIAPGGGDPMPRATRFGDFRTWSTRLSAGTAKKNPLGAGPLQPARRASPPNQKLMAPGPVDLTSLIPRWARTPAASAPIAPPVIESQPAIVETLRTP